MSEDRSARSVENNEVLSQLFRIAAESGPMEQMLRRCLDAIFSLSWLALMPKGGIFLTDYDNSGKRILRLSVEHNLGERINSLCAQVPFGHCLCGRAALEQRPLYADCIDNRHDIRYDGMEPHGHYNIPIMEGEHLLGVLVLYLPAGEARDEEKIDFLTHCATVLALSIDLRRKEQQLARANRELAFQKRALDQHAIVSITDVQGNITYANDKFCEISGYSQEELFGQNHRILKSGLHPDSYYEEIWRTITGGQTWHGLICNRAKQGQLYWVEATIVPFLNEAGKPFQYVSIRTDVSERKQMEHALEESQRIARLGSWSLDLVHDHLIWSDEIFSIFGIEPERFAASLEAFFDTIHPDDLEKVKTHYADSLAGRCDYDIEHRIIRRDNGEVRWVHERCAHQHNELGEVVRSDGTVQDITERKLVEQEIKRLAMTDQLTGLANRNLFHRRFSEMLNLARREERSVALLLIDLDKFKPVNDTYGHQVGDEVLKAVADRFLRHVRQSDLVARLGGDEFAALLYNPGDRESIAQCAQRILEDVARPVTINGHPIRIGASIGIACFPGEAGSEDGLVAMADVALYAAKHGGRNCFRFHDRTELS